MLSAPCASISHNARPLTPPQACEEAYDSIDLPTPALIVPPPSEQNTVGTLTPPQSSPPSSQNGATRKRVKKVEFCQFAQELNSSPRASPSDLARRRHCALRQPLKSILKSTAHLPPTPTPDEPASCPSSYFSPDGTPSYPKMIESVLTLLSSSTLDLRLDGYQTLNRAFKTYSNLPDEDALKSSIGQISQFIVRDVTTVPRDTWGMNVITQALKLATVLVSTPTLASSLTTEFQLTLLDNALDTVAQPAVIKAIANHFLYMLAAQRFPPRVMTAAKAEILLNALDTVHERISGNSVIASRLAIYATLVDQLPTLMLSKIKLWLKHTFHGILSSHKDIRQRAIDLGMSAALALGKQQAAGKALVDLFASESDHGLYGDYLIARLNDLLYDRTSRTAVTKIWAMVMLFTQNRKQPITAWPIFRHWLLLIQRCMNCGDLCTRHDAALAWNKLIFATGLERAALDPNEKIVAVLKAPFLHAFGKPIDAVNTRDFQSIAFHSYCGLLFYALQPSQSSQRLTAMWDIHVAPIMPTLLRAGGRECKYAVKALKALLHGSAATWHPQRAIVGKAISPHELPRLDARWVRSRLPTILALLEDTLDASLRLRCFALEASTPWPELMAALADAGRHEVRASLDFKTAIAHLVNFFQRLWSRAALPNISAPSEAWTSHFTSLLTATTRALGIMHFAESSLTTEPTGALVTLYDPTRLSKHPLPPISPMAVLSKLFLERPASVTAIDDYRSAAAHLFCYFVKSQTTTEAQLAFVDACIPKELLENANEGYEDETGFMANVLIETTFDIVATQNVTKNQNSADKEMAQHLVSTLSRILSIRPSDRVLALPEKSDRLTTSLTAICSRMSSNAGSLAVNIDLIAPLCQLFADYAAQLPSSARLSYAETMLSHYQWSTENVVDSDHNTEAGLDLVCTLICANADITDDLTWLSSFVKAIERWIVNCPPQLLGSTLRRIEPGLAMLLRNGPPSKCEIPVPGDVFDSSFESELLRLWKTVLGKLYGTVTDSIFLRTFNGIFLAAFCSPLPSIVCTTINAWNEMFEKVTDIEYSDTLAHVLRRLAMHVELHIPSLDNCGVHSQLSVDIPFLERNDEARADDDDDVHGTSDDEMQPLLLAITKEPSALKTRQPTTRDAIGKSTSLMTRPARPPRLHDDSQVDFCNIESSPLPVVQAESQHLTDRQIDVLTRQHDEAARLYPELTSSPIPKFARSRLPSTAMEEDIQLPTNVHGEDIDLLEHVTGTSPSSNRSKPATMPPSDDAVASQNQMEEDTTLTPSVTPNTADDGVQQDEAISAEPLISDTNIAQVETEAVQSNDTACNSESTGIEEVSHIDDSIVEVLPGSHGSPDRREQMQTPDGPMSSEGILTRSGSKRKREEELTQDDRARNHKRVRRYSPMKQLLDRLWGAAVSAEEEETAEPIVVASQPVESLSTRSTEVAEAIRSSSQPTALSSPLGTNLVEIKGSKSKDRRVISQSQPLRRSKRKSCSQGDDEANDRRDDLVMETSVPRKVRRLSTQRGVRAGRFSQAEERVPASHISRIMEAVVVPTTRPRTEHDKHDKHDNAADEGGEPSAQPTAEPAAAASQSSSQGSSTGKSLFGKLMDVWKDFSRIALGFQEANEFDDMLQDIRKEVMQAEKRGRQQDETREVTRPALDTN